MAGQGNLNCFQTGTDIYKQYKLFWLVISKNSQNVVIQFICTSCLFMNMVELPSEVQKIYNGSCYHPQPAKEKQTVKRNEYRFE